MNIDITKIANVILYMIDSKVLHLNNKKLEVMLFLIDYSHNELFKEKVFNENYIRDSRGPLAEVLSEIFNIIINSEDLNEDDERLFVIQELLDHLDIEVVSKQKYIELNFIKMEEEFDEDVFTKDELKTIKRIVDKYKSETPRKMANICFAIDKVRSTENGKLIL